MSRHGRGRLCCGLGRVCRAGRGKAKPPASIWEQETLTGDWNGARTALKDKGIDNHAQLHRRDLRRALGRHQPPRQLRRQAGILGRYRPAKADRLDRCDDAFHDLSDPQQRHNAAENVGSIADPSNIDALPTTRLFTAWFEQSFGEHLAVRIGQLADDDEFIISPTAGGLINGTFGWAGILAANMTSGGPAYPLATPGVRLKVSALENLTLLAAVSPAIRRPQLQRRAAAMQQIRHDLQLRRRLAVDGRGAIRHQSGQGREGLAGVYKLGVWYATANFADQHFGLNGGGAVVSLADPAAAVAQPRGNWGIYGVADQMVWRGANSSLNLFLRAGASPSDRNLLSFYIDGGAGLKGPLPGRADDVLTFGFAYAKISPEAAALDRDMLAFAGPPFPIRDYEMVFELSYQAQLAPWWIVQPDLQWIVHPGGNMSDPNNPAVTVANAFVVGIRSTVKF